MANAVVNFKGEIVKILDIAVKVTQPRDGTEKVFGLNTIFFLAVHP